MNYYVFNCCILKASRKELKKFRNEANRSMGQMSQISIPVLPRCDRFILPIVEAQHVIKTHSHMMHRQ